MPLTEPTDPFAEPQSFRLDSDALPAALRPYLREIAEQAMPEPMEPVSFALSATTLPNLNVTLEGRGHVVMPPAYGGRTVPLDPFSLAGPQVHPVVVEVASALRGMDVLFSPVGPFALLGVVDYRLSPDGPPPLHEVVRPDLAEEVQAWRDDVLAAPSAGTPPAEAFAARAARIVAFLEARLDDVPREADFLGRAVDAVEAAEGVIGMAALAREMGVSTATLRRRFAVIGLPLKRFSAVVRFRHAHLFLATTPGATCADAVHRFGYADQAHLVREHRRFSGAPPTRWSIADRSFDRLGGPPDA
ncbi:AraC family transcriptional regulator [Rubrivirga marina]|uniref:HTH araC/xylS-type domain-containing protein n=1 Tax=Rubrivirga marina TaxID=1196024 RepID=A0A271IWV0_9BACT|nr:helix-turn-helix domain-containing protein [Rubrivirga marina]PAP75600.1 hypothetical protein BSZ37_03690 [Rubrivirga marina]